MTAEPKDWAHPEQKLSLDTRYFHPIPTLKTLSRIHFYVIFLSP